MKKSKLNINKCYCSGPNKKPLIAIAGCSDDLAAVSALPDTWTPRKGGSTLSNYLKERERNYNEATNTLIIEAKAINEDIDVKVRELAQVLSLHIQENQNEILCLIENSKSKIPLSVDESDAIIKQITKLADERIEDLSRFKQESLRLERQRANGLMTVLQNNFNRLIAIGHKPPKILLHEFDQRIYDINQQLLSNNRAYIELEAQLRLQLDENIIRAKSILNQLRLGDNVVKMATFPPTMNDSQLQSNSDVVVLKSNKTTPKIDEKYFSKMLESYRTVCDRTLNYYSRKIEDLYKQISNDQLCRLDSMELLNVPQIDDISLDCSTIIGQLDPKDNIYKMIVNDTSIIKKSLSSLAKQFRDMYTTLQNSFQINFDHMNRFSLGQKLIMAGLDDIQSTHDGIELSNEINVNIALEQMRTASDYDKLQQYYDNLTNHLSKIYEIHSKHREAEMKKIEDFTNVSSVMSHVILSDIDYFRLKHPKVPQILETQNKSTETKNEILSLRAPLLERVLETDLQAQEICEYNNYYLDSLDNNFKTVLDCVNNQTRQWVHDKTDLLKIRYSLKNMTQSIRAERMKYAYESRLLELRFHESLISSHLGAMYDIIDKMPIEASDYLAIDAPELYPFCKWIGIIKVDMEKLSAESTDSEFKRLKMTSYAHRLVNHRQQFEESLLTVFEKRKRDIGIDVQKARISNVNFLSRIKLFHEGGRYASTEAVKSCVALVKAGDALESAFNRTLDVLNHRRLQLISLADLQLMPLQRVVDDDLNAFKNILEKKVLNLNKKK